MGAHTFDAANERIESLGLENFRCTAHMLRHSFALRWYAVGKLIKYSRLGHLSAGEQRDFREEIGDVWHLVQTMLGHHNVETTRASTWSLSGHWKWKPSWRMPTIPWSRRS